MAKPGLGRMGGSSSSPGSSAPSAFHTRAGNNSANRELNSDTIALLCFLIHQLKFSSSLSSWKALFAINFPGTREPHRAVSSSAAGAAEQDNPWEFLGNAWPEPGAALAPRSPWVCGQGWAVQRGLGLSTPSPPGAHPTPALAAPPIPGILFNPGALFIGFC